MEILGLFLAAGVVLLLLVAANSVKIVRQHEKGVVEHLGRFQSVKEPGLQLVVPFMQYIRRVDLRERVLDVAPQDVITEDNVVVTVDAVIYYQVTDPVRVLYQVHDFHLAIVKLAQTNLRNVIGGLELDQTLTSRERINAELRTILDEATDVWGVRITRVEIQKIDPPRDITEAMSRQMKAERERRAVILEAEGVKSSAILRAEGQKQSAILSAEGEAEATKRVADAHAYREKTLAEGQGQAIKTVFTAIHEGGATDEVIRLRYLETLAKIADGQATKIFLPTELSSILSGVGAMGEAFRGEAPVGHGKQSDGKRAAAKEKPEPEPVIDTSGLR